MLVDIFNSFEPVRFLIDSPLWVSFFAPGVAFTLILGAVHALLKLTIREKKEVKEASFALGALVGVAWLFGMMLTLLEVFTRAGVAGGYPQVLAMLVGFALNTLTAFVIIRAVLVLRRFTHTHPKFQKLVSVSHENTEQ